MIDGVCSYTEGKAVAGGQGPLEERAKSRGDDKAPRAGSAVSHQAEDGGMLQLGRDASRIPGRRWPSLVEKVLHSGSE